METTLEPTMLLLLLGAGLAGGCVNALAGGATFFTFPAMLATGLPPVVANASNAVAVWPASVTATFAFRRSLPQRDRWLALSLAVTLAGALLGAWLLLQSDEGLFMALVPWLLLSATLLFAFAGPLQRRLAQRRPPGPARALPLQALAAVYGGYFGAGLGIMLLAVLALAGGRDIRSMNAVKNLLSALVGLVALLVFAGSGAIAWPETLVMLSGAVAGGWIGGRFGQRAPAGLIRAVVIGVGTLLTLVYFLRA